MTGSKFSNMTLLLQNDQIHRTSDVLDSLWLPTSSSPFNGSSSMVSFEKASGAEMGSFFDDDECDGSLLRPGKKRRLSGDQVQFLEKSFDVDNKLEPERKVQIAKELGLQPRQVAIWFQNRKARYKSKQLEKDYDILRSSFDKMQSDFDDLVKEKEKLEQQVMVLKEKLLKRGNPETNQFTAQELQLLQEHVPKTLSEKGSDPDSVVAPTMLVCKQEDASSAKSDVLDPDSAHYTPHSNSLLEPTTADSSNVFESDEDDDNFTRSFLPAPPVPSYLWKLEDGLFIQHSNGGSASSCNFGFQNEDQLFCFWP